MGRTHLGRGGCRMSRAASATAVAIGCGAMFWGFWNVAAASATTWVATGLDWAWIGGGLAITCMGAYALGNDLREDAA